MEITLTTTEIVAWWGAIVATFVFTWDIFKWSTSGPKLRINVRPNMKTYGMPRMDGNTYVIVEAVNIGDRPTTIIVIGLRYYENWCQKLRKKPNKSFVSPNPVMTQELPHVLEPGKMWTGGLLQNEELEKMAREGILICEVYDSWHKKAFNKRVTLKQESPNNAFESDAQ